MSQAVKNNRGFLQLLAVCPAHILKKYILITEENKRIVWQYKDALVNLAETNVPYKTKKRILVQEGDGFIQDLLLPAVRSLGFLML